MDDLNLNQVKDGELQKFEEPGLKIIGVLKSYTPRTTKMGEGHVYEVKTKNGTLAFFAPSLLHKKLQDVPMGNIVKIEYVKKTKTAGGTDLKHFEVSHGDPTPERLKAVGVELTDKTVTGVEYDQEL